MRALAPTFHDQSPEDYFPNIVEVAPCYRSQVIDWAYHDGKNASNANAAEELKQVQHPFMALVENFLWRWLSGRRYPSIVLASIRLTSGGGSLP